MKYETEYIQILKEELKPAMGCTEPIAIAYAASICREQMDEVDRVEVYVSGNIIKNVKSVIVPNTHGLRGIKAACAIGMVGGNPKLELECISKVTDEEVEACKEVLNQNIIEVYHATKDYVFDIHIFMYHKEEVCEVRIVDYHTNVVLLKKNDTILLEKKVSGVKESSLTDRGLLNVEDIFDFANSVSISKIKDLLELQEKYNMAIAEEGLNHLYGANVGKTILKSEPNCLHAKAKAYAAAGSDARMNGCHMPVVINSGSGNQGMTCSIPVIVYANELNVGVEKKLRALALSNLLTIHIKTDIGRLSAYCGAIAAGCACGAAISYLYGGGLKEINHTLVNALAIASGVICDGAKASCAAKISLAVDAGILGYQMYLCGNQFKDGDGIVKKGVENTIHNVGLLASEGMVETDKEIIKLMME